MIQYTKRIVRRQMDRLAVAIDQASHGFITPNIVTAVSLGGHFIVAYYLIYGHLLTAALLLIFFGLLDALDGALARQQKIASVQGMFLDASSDRLKEIILYTACAIYFANSNLTTPIIWCVAACGVSVLISYIKAKGEAAIASLKHIQHESLNRIFQDGLASFEIRISALIVGLISGELFLAIILITIVGAVTAGQRFIMIYRYLHDFKT
ncbi:MAG: CDP-alcohol phosphatidyltransferase family protein [Candidatus Saccharimonadales bacterium]